MPVNPSVRHTWAEFLRNGLNLNKILFILTGQLLVVRICTGKNSRRDAHWCWLNWITLKKVSLKCDFYIFATPSFFFFITNNFFIFLDNDIVRNPGEALNDDPREKMQEKLVDVC